MSSSGQEVHASECPNGSHLLIEPILLDCKHVLCRPCIEQYSDVSTGYITCPFCSQQTPISKAAPLPIAFPLLDPTKPRRAKGKVHGATYPALPSYGADKLMEEDLLGSSEEESEFDKMQQELDRIREQEDQEEEEKDDEKGNQNDQYNFEYTVLRVEGGNLDIKKTLDTSWDITDVTKRLAKAIEDNDNIIGFYDSYAKDKIYIDIEEGHIESVAQLIKKVFPGEWLESRFEIVEQENSPEFFIATGAKIAACQVEGAESSVAVERSIDQHPDRLDSDYGTVTCLGISDNAENYALTAKHVLNKENRTQTAQGRFVSSFNSKLTHISEKFLGIMGAFTVAEQEKQVDIAALPLSADIVHKFDQTMIHKLNDCYAGSDEQLEGVRVTKQGASSGFTSGHVIKGSYTHRQNRSSKIMTGSFVLIEPAHGYHEFGVGGDSGALIWSTSGIPIGIVSKGMRDHKFMGQKINTVWGVRLDHCLAALRREVNVNIVECRAYGAPLPLAAAGHQR